MPDYPHVIFDLRHRSLEVILSDVRAVGTRELDDAHLVDVDADERPVSIEILTLDDLMIEEMGHEFGFSDQVPAIRAEIEKAMTPTGTAVSYGEPKVIPGHVTLTYASAITPAEAESETPTWVIN